MKMLWLGCALGLLLAGCGGSDGGSKDVTPKLIEKGGVGSGAIDGTLNVYVIDARNNTPLTGANVRVGAAADANALTGTTDTTGLISFKDAKLKGAQSISAWKTGYNVSTWIGANGANVTIPIGHLSIPTPDTATINGTIQGWSNLPTPAANHTTLALVYYSQLDDFDDPANAVEQETDSTTKLDKNICYKTAQLASGAFKLITRTGPQSLYAILADMDNKGTADTKDDIFTVTGYAFKTGLALNKGQTLTGEELVPMASGDLVNATLTFPTAPTGLDNRYAIPRVKLGKDDNLNLNLFSPETPTQVLPKLTGPLANAQLDLFGGAQAAGDKPAVQTFSVLHKTNPAGPFTIPAWLGTPEGLAAQSGTYSFTAVSGATVHSVDFLNSNGLTVWSVFLLDGSASFSLPSLTGNPISTATQMKGNAFDFPGWKLDDFNLANVADAMARFSKRTKPLAVTAATTW